MIVTSGSMGDVAPYTGLGVRLRSAGHEVTIAAHAPFRALAEGLGLGFAPLPGDLRETLARAARRLGLLGVAPPPVPMSALSVPSLARALRAVTSNPHFAARAQALSARIRAEDGAAPILEWLEAV